MVTNKIVVNKGNFIEFVQVIDDVPYAYKLEEGDILVDDLKGLSMSKPFWNGEEWIETKTYEEIAEEDIYAGLTPSYESIDKAKFELRVINTLMEAGII